MSGKAYTLREMKLIVDYLVEQKAYGETKGRKMWVTFASSQLTTRTWQSLKETFLKRILPDIHNPYYKLTMEQARSFKEGHDVEARSKNKLELQTVSDASTSNGQKETNGEETKPTSTAKEVDLPSGEDIKSAPITRNRSSVDTLVLDDPYYSNAEEIQNVLENTLEDDINEELYKPLKDCLTFEQSEPFHIDAMRVLEDFATDSEGSDKGLRMDIDENLPDTNNKEAEREAEDLIVIPDSEDTEEVPNNPIEAEVNVVVFGKETENSNDQLPSQILDKDETVPDNNQTDTNQTDTDQNDTNINQPNIINDQPVVISDQSDTNNDENENNKETDPDVFNVNNDTSDVLLSYDTSDVNNDQAEKTDVNNDQAEKTDVNNDQAEKTETTDDKQDKVAEKVDKAKVVKNNTPPPEKESLSKPKSLETVETADITVRDEEMTVNAPGSPAKIRISEPIPNSNVTISTSSNITDSLIPNNQEALDDTDTQPKLQVTQEKVKKSRKRSSSRESACNKKIKLDESVLQSDKEIQPTNKEKTDMRKMESEDLFGHVDSQQNKETDKPIENNAAENQPVEDIGNDEAENNPCLKSVSLFAEQFNTTKLLDSESEDENIKQSNSQPLKPENISKEPEKISKQSDSNSKESANNSKELDNKSKEPAKNPEQPDNKSKEPAKNFKQPDKKSKESTNNSKEAVNKSKEPAKNSKLPDSNSKEPANSSKHADNNSKELATTSKQSDNNSKEPASSTKHPDNNSKDTATTSKQSDYNSKETATTSKQSDNNNSKETASTSKQSDNNSKEPANTSKQTENTSNSKIEVSNDPIILKSNSDSEDNIPKASLSKLAKFEKVKDKVRKESILANMLGFGGNVTRKRRISHRRSRTNRHSLTRPSDSSDWTSESDDNEFVSPPRGRRNRQTRKYLKPKSARILSLNEEGGLFVMHGKKLYPLVKDGKNVKNYLSYHIDSDSEEEDHSYWRQKYVEEKMRADELEKRLKSNEPRTSDRSDVPIERKSPILQSNTVRNPNHKQQNESTNKVFAVTEKDKEPVKSSASSSQEKLKICFSKNNQEVQLEGYWPQIHPALQQVVELLHTDDSNGKSKQKPKQSTKPVYNKEESKKTTEAMEIESVEIDSGKTTPIIPTIDPATHEKVSKIESEIFKEIEKQAKEEEPKLSGADNINTGKRGRGRPSKTSLSLSTPKPEKQPGTSKPATRQSRTSSKNEKLDVSPSKRDQKEKSESKSVEKKQSITKSDEKDESISKELKKRETSFSKQGEKPNETITKTDDALMKRPSRAPKRLLAEEESPQRMSTRRSTSRKSERLNDDEIRYKLPPNKKDTTPTVTTKKSSQSNPEDISLRSVESTQGYQDSDPSPINAKRRRKPSFKVHKSKKQVKRISLPNLTELLSSDSSNSSYFIPLRKYHSTLSSTVYKTDSYELLMPKEKPLTLLDPINEDQNSDEIRHLNSLSRDEENRSSSSNIMVEIGSSSNVSLPLSPELSVVENLTISREMIKPSISLNETELNKMDCDNMGDENKDYNKYMISNIDVSCPLMEQECGLQNANENDNNKPTPATVTTKEKSISDTINKKLHDLLLESAKKISNKDEKMDVDETVQKAKPKKRSSTPRKRKTAKQKPAKNQKQDQVNCLLEEEHIEACFYAGRTSCPPVITVIPPEENANFAKTPADKKLKKKKDVIKVKIQRPKSQTREKSISKNRTKSSITDSGINDPDNFSGMFLKGNDSVDLIHNHSDTCLNANECIGDSIQFIDNSVKSVITLNSNSSDSELKSLMDSADKSVDTFPNDAQDISALTKLPNLVEEIFRSPSATFPSPATNSSLITEDLSNSPPPTKWYLLSEDDTNTQVQGVRSYGSNLNQIFTACAVPNLSTITEKSVDSRKVKDYDTPNSDSQSLF